MMILDHRITWGVLGTVRRNVPALSKKSKGLVGHGFMDWLGHTGFQAGVSGLEICEEEYGWRNQRKFIRSLKITMLLLQIKQLKNKS